MKTLHFFPGSAAVAALLVVLLPAHPGRSQTIATVAGNSTWVSVRDVFVDSAGSMYVADGFGQVYKIDRLGVTTTIAGIRGSGEFAGDGGPATSASLSGPSSVVVAPDGTVYISDSDNNRIRKIAPNGIITTYAGTGDADSTGDGGPALSAAINQPGMLALDTHGNLYFVDDNRIRKISASGVITTAGGTGKTSRSPDGNLATATDMAPGWIKVVADGTIYYTDSGYGGDAPDYARVRKIAPNGIVSTVAGTGVIGFNGDGGPAISAELRLPSGVAVDPAGSVYISDAGNHRIRKVGLDGIIKTYAGNGVAGNTGDGGPALSAELGVPYGLALDSSGNLYVLDAAFIRIRKISPPAVPALSASNFALPSFLGKAGFSSNTYLEIYGTNLAQTTRTWAGGDFNGSNAPTSLDGVSVTLNGKPAFVYYISPTQININTPDDTAIGPVQIQVKNSLGVSNAGTVNRARISPSLQTVPQFLIGGKQYVVALTPDFLSFIGRPNMLAGVSFIAAKPGSTISLYALGCGPTTPPTQAGVVAALASPLSLSYELRIGGVPANVTFAGIVGGSIGLYQFNVVVPNVAAGDQPIELTVDGVSAGQGLTIVVGQ
jgi:uncharacterized protein (TIGR03437 family)